MDLLNITWPQIADIGFGLLVAGICLRTLLTDKDSLLKQRALWKHELTELEKSLQTLIMEATESSQVFDTRIQRRQRELQELLDKAEARIATITNTSENFKMVPADRKSNTRHSTNSTRTNTNNIYEDEDSWIISERGERRLSQDIEMLDDKSTRTQSTQTQLQQRLERQRIATKQAKEEAKIQEEKEAEEDLEIFKHTSIVDPIVFRIAKRLLLEGKELHVVARKLELPVSEIRHLDGLLREQAVNRAKELPKALKEKELGTVRSVIRARTDKEQTELDLDNMYGGF